MYVQDSVTVTVRKQLYCEGEGVIEVQDNTEVWWTLMLTIRYKVQGQGYG